MYTVWQVDKYKITFKLVINHCTNEILQHVEVSSGFSRSGIIDARARYRAAARRLRNTGVEVLLYSFFNLGTRRGWVVNSAPRPLYPWEREPLPIAQEAGWAPGPVWKGVEKISPPPGFDPRNGQPVANIVQKCLQFLRTSSTPLILIPFSTTLLRFYDSLLCFTKQFQEKIAHEIIRDVTHTKGALSFQNSVRQNRRTGVPAYRCTGVPVYRQFQQQTKVQRAPNFSKLKNKFSL